ncbi:MAG TPA: hypothetical protein VGR36_07155 [Candidatus Acidoferrales bacterium]|nr:hypothetical protein [Candidatus Acidoferrales bacterium]
MWLQIKEALAQSTTRFLTRFAGLLPGLVAFIVAIVVSLVVAIVLAFLIRRLLDGLEFEKHLSSWGFGSMEDWSPTNRPTLLVARSIAFLVILIGFVIGIAAFNAQWTTMLAQALFAYIPNIIGAVLVLLVGVIVARFLGRSVLIGAVNMNLQHARLLSVGVKWLVIVLAVAMALDHLRIAPGIVELAFGILFGGIVLSLSLAVGLGSKELVSKSLERDARRSSEVLEDPLRHL